MRRLLRILFNVATVVSLLLCVATVVLWVWTRERGMKVVFSRYTTQPEQVDSIEWDLGCDGGRVGLGRHRIRATQWEVRSSRAAARRHGLGWRRELVRGAGLGGWYDDAQTPSAWGPIRWHFDGRELPAVGFDHRTLVVPCWLVVVCTGAWPLTVIGRNGQRRSRRRHRPGLCPKCGYDLRATPDRCPECGTIPSR